MKPDLIPFSPISVPPDLLLALKNPRPVLFAGGILLALIAAWLLFVPRNRKGRVVRLGGLTWKRNQFCRGWLITGDTGSGKTSSGINQLAHQVFQNEPKWGGLCIDEKGVYWETLAAMAKHYDREHDLVHLQIRTDDTDTQWTPPNRYNLTGDRSIPFTTYAKFIVDTATSLGQGGDKGFFKSQAQTHIAHALELLFELNRPVTLLNAFELLSDRDLLEEEMENLEPLLETPRRAAVYAHFANRFLNQPEEQHGGVRETIGNYLQYFLTPEVAEVFCTGESTFDFATIDQGKIILTTMPQKFQTERRYVNTFLKLLYYSHALRRFDKPKSERARDNLIILWADEAQRFMTASEDGTSDYNCVDVIREAGATIVAAAQSTTSFVPPLGNDKSKGAHAESPQPSHLPRRRRSRCCSSCRFSRQKARRETLMGIQRRQAQRQLLRNRRTQNQTAQAPQSPRPRVCACSLRARLPARDVATAGS